MCVSDAAVQVGAVARARPCGISAGLDEEPPSCSCVASAGGPGSAAPSTSPSRPDHARRSPTMRQARPPPGRGTGSRRQRRASPAGSRCRSATAPRTACRAATAMAAASVSEAARRCTGISMSAPVAAASVQIDDEPADPLGAKRTSAVVVPPSIAGPTATQLPKRSQRDVVFGPAVVAEAVGLERSGRRRLPDHRAGETAEPAGRASRRLIAVELDRQVAAETNGNLRERDVGSRKRRRARSTVRRSVGSQRNSRRRPTPRLRPKRRTPRRSSLRLAGAASRLSREHVLGLGPGPDPHEPQPEGHAAAVRAGIAARDEAAVSGERRSAGSCGRDLSPATTARASVSEDPSTSAAAGPGQAVRNGSSTLRGEAEQHLRVTSPFERDDVQGVELPEAVRAGRADRPADVRRQDVA